MSTARGEERESGRRNKKQEECVKHVCLFCFFMCAFFLHVTVPSCHRNTPPPLLSSPRACLQDSQTDSHVLRAQVVTNVAHRAQLLRRLGRTERDRHQLEGNLSSLAGRFVRGMQEDEYVVSGRSGGGMAGRI